MSFGMNSSERRQHQRIEWRGSVHVVIPGGQPLEATIADISERGCGLNATCALEPGSVVGIDGTGFEGTGVVRYCYPLNGHFRIGIELTPAA